MRTRSYSVLIVLSVGICFGLLWQTGAWSQANIPYVTSLTAVQEEQGHKSPVDAFRRLRDSVRANPPYVSIDISYTQRTIVPVDVFRERQGKAKEVFERMAKERGLKNLDVNSPGFINAANEHVALSEQTVRIWDLAHIRTDVTWFAGSDESSSKTREIVNIYDNGTFYLVNRTDRTIEVYDRPQFHGTNGVRLLYAGKTAGHPKLTADVLSTTDANSAVHETDKSRSEMRYVGPVTEDGRAMDHLEILHRENERRECGLFLDPNNWGRCCRIVSYDKDTGGISKIDEFSNWRPVEREKDLYPSTMVYHTFDKQAREQERQVLEVSRVATNVEIPREFLSIRTQEFAGFDIIDYRFSPPLKTINRVEDRRGDSK